MTKFEELNIPQDIHFNHLMAEIKGCINTIEYYANNINKLYLIAKKEENKEAINLVTDYEKEFYDKYHNGLLK